MRTLVVLTAAALLAAPASAAPDTSKAEQADEHKAEPPQRVEVIIRHQRLPDVPRWIVEPQRPSDCPSGVRVLRGGYRGC